MTLEEGRELSGFGDYITFVAEHGPALFCYYISVASLLFSDDVCCF